jgi:hypothetical protein
VGGGETSLFLECLLSSRAVISVSVTGAKFCVVDVVERSKREYIVVCE